MSEDDSNRTLLDFEPSSDDEAGDEGEAGDDGSVGAEDGSVGAEDGSVGAEDGSVAGEDGGVGDDADGDPDAGDDGSGAVVRDVASVPPAVSTSRFVPDGEPCASCESSTRRLWVVEGDPVCADCKSW